MAWLDDQLDFRWAGISPGRTFALNASGLASCSRFRRMAALDARQHRYLSLNRFDAICRWQEHETAFVRSERNSHQPVLGERQTQFGNLAVSWGFQTTFLTNWCDAQGFDYQHWLPELRGTPVLQYVRRRKQRGQVVLFPLDWSYMGPGSSNLPIAPDPVPFAAKADRLTWRGRVSGVIDKLDQGPSGTWWAESIFNPHGANERAVQLLQQTPRWKVAHALRDVTWADVRFTMPSKHQALLDANPELSALLSPLTGQPLGQAAQRQGKFLLVVDGNDIGTNKYWSLLSNSVTLIVDSEWETALDAGLEPWVHYVPVRPEREAIEATVDDLLRHPQRCLDIIQAAHALLRPQLDVELREAADYATLRRYSQQVFCMAGLPTQWSLARRSTAPVNSDAPTAPAPHPHGGHAQAR